MDTADGEAHLRRDRYHSAERIYISAVEPAWRRIGLNQANGAISVVRSSTDRAPQFLSFNERGHLGPQN